MYFVNASGWGPSVQRACGTTWFERHDGLNVRVGERQDSSRQIWRGDLHVPYTVEITELCSRLQCSSHRTTGVQRSATAIEPTSDEMARFLRNGGIETPKLRDDNDMTYSGAKIEIVNARTDSSWLMLQCEASACEDYRAPWTACLPELEHQR